MLKLDGGIWAVVPVKDFAQAKHRLSPVLSSSERQALSQAMLQDVLAALAGADGLAGIVVVTRDPLAIALAESVDAKVLYEAENRGHTNAARSAAEQLRAAGAAAMMTLPGDLPLITATEVEHILACHRAAVDQPVVTIVPAHDRAGSNCVVCSPPDCLPLSFGDNSYLPHLQTARRLGITPNSIVLPGLALDIDQPADLKVFAAQTSDTRAFAYLQSSAILKRLK